MLSRERRHFRPLRVVDFDLGCPTAATASLEGYAGARALVRLFGVPVGYVDVTAEGDTPLWRRIADAAVAPHGDALVRCAMRHALDEAVPEPGALLERLLRPPPAWCGRATPLVTVAVCTRDRPADLRLCLEGLLRLDWPALDLLVIDNAPATDATRSLVAGGFPTVRYVTEPRPGLDWARNRAIAEARGEIIAFADDDVVVDAGWVRALAAVFEDEPDAMAVTGLVVPYELETEAQLAFEDHRGYESGFHRTWNRVDREAGGRAAVEHGAIGKLGTGANMAYRKRVFERIGGFDPALDVGTVTQGGGDIEMFFRILKEGYTLVREPRAVSFHRNRRTHDELRAQISTWGIGMYSYVVRSCIAYPDERPGFAWIVARWLLLRNTRRLLRSLVRPQIRAELVWDEMKRSVLAPLRYRTARRRAAEIAERYGPPPFGDTPAVERGRSKRTVRRGRLSRRVDLGEPPAALVDAGSAGVVDLRVSWGGRPVGAVSIRSRGRPLGAARIRDAIAETLTPSLLRHAGLDEARVLRELQRLHAQGCAR
jgi:O-antigen biosynthesis protein